ncbi:Bug family tripartite tricarboxylate transporter substrate binding protein [Cupriavidus basilensis]
MVVDNAPGASGTIGAIKTINAPADGYTLLLGSNGEISIARLTNPKIKYDGQRDLVPLRMVGSQPMVLVSGAQSGIRGVDGFLALAKSRKAVNYGTSGIGTPLHLSGELIRGASKVDMTHVPYKGGAPGNRRPDGQPDRVGRAGAVDGAAADQESGKLQAIGAGFGHAFACRAQYPRAGGEQGAGWCRYAFVVRVVRAGQYAQGGDRQAGRRARPRDQCAGGQEQAVRGWRGRRCKGRGRLPWVYRQGNRGLPQDRQRSEYPGVSMPMPGFSGHRAGILTGCGSA